MSRCAFTRVFELPGWSEQSVWGYDELFECYWAQLWRDDDRFDEPRISISCIHLLPTVTVLARVVADRVGIDDDQAWLALVGPRPIGRAETASGARTGVQHIPVRVLEGRPSDEHRPKTSTQVSGSRGRGDLIRAR